MRQIRRKLAWDEGGVSELIGTFLILAITVIIFSGIILWVGSFPGPTPTRRADLDATAEPDTWINITHRGGEALKGFRTVIILFVNGVAEQLQTQGTRQSNPDLGMAYGIAGDQNWNAGETWYYKNASIDMSQDDVEVLVIDTDSNTVVWTKELLGVAGEHPPLFTSKWLDHNPSTITRDTPEDGATFGIYAQILDKDGDLLTNSVFVNFTFLSNGLYQLYDDGSHGDLFAGDSVFTATDTGLVAELAWDGGILVYNATDSTGRKVTSRLVMSVVEARQTTIIYNNDSGGSGGRPNGTWNVTLGDIPHGSSGPFGDYGYGIYNDSGRPSANNSGGDETRIFYNYDRGDGSDHVVVVARSTVVKNAFRINTFILYDDQGNKVSPITKEYDSMDPSKNTPAFNQTLIQPWFEFVYEFDVTGLTPGAYPVFFQIKDNAGDPPLTVNELIYVTTDGTIPDYPRIETFRDPNRDGDLSDITASAKFSYREKIYVRLTFADRDTDTSYITNYSGDVEIEDIYARYPVKRRPNNTPVSAVTLWDDTWGDPDEACPQQPNACYVLNIDLIKKNQDPWVPGINWYTLRTRMISDEGVPGTAELYQMLAVPVEITTPSSTLDVVTTTDTGGGKGQGRGTYWYENGDYWQEHVVDFIEEKIKKPLALATGDVNGDTMTDIVVGTDEDKRQNIYLYINENYGQSFRRYFISNFASTDGKYKAQALAVCDFDGDGDGDILAGIANKKAPEDVGAIIFWNDGGWTTQVLTYDNPGNKAEVNAVACGDINQDGRPDIVTGDKNKNVIYFENDVFGAFISPAENGNFPPLHVNCFKDSYLIGTTTDAVMENTLRLGQMEGVSAQLDPNDPNADDTVDVVLRGKRKEVWYYTTEITNPGTHAVAFHFKSFAPAVPKDIISLDIGDFNNDDIIDVALGIDHLNDKSNTWRMRNNGIVETSPEDCTPSHDCTFNGIGLIELPHTVIDPLKGGGPGLAKMGKILDIAVGDVDADGDNDIVVVGDMHNDGIGNLFWFRNDGDASAAEWSEFAIDTNSFFNKHEKVFAVELDYMDL